MRLRIPGVGTAREPFTFLHDGHIVEARAGDTVAAALIDAGRYTCRVANDGSSRGVFCGMGACGECAMTVDDAPGTLACMTKAKADLAVETMSPSPSIGKSVPNSDEHREISPDVLVVGAGPAGLAATATLAESGANVVLVDERSTLGGQFYKQPAAGRSVTSSALDRQFRAGRELIERARAAGAIVLSGTNIWGAFSADLFVGEGNGISWTFRPRRVVLATGARERPVPIPGWTLPGVMMTGAAQTLIRSAQVAPGERVLVAGNGPLNMQVAAELVSAGVNVVALAELADLRVHRQLNTGLGMAISSPSIVRLGMKYRSVLARAGVPVLDRTAAVAVHGTDAVERATLASVDSQRQPIAGTERDLTVDNVCFGYGFVPSNEISRALGCSHGVDPKSGNLLPVTSAVGRTSIDTVWVVGDAGVIAGAYVAKAMAEVAAADVILSLGLAKPADRHTHSRRELTLRRHRRFQKSLWNMFGNRQLTLELAQPDTTVCRCESVTLDELRQSFATGATTPGAVKRITRAGMGRCQGRYCSTSILALYTEASGRSPDEFTGFAPQAPIRPTEVRHIAGSVSPPTATKETLR